MGGVFSKFGAVLIAIGGVFSKFQTSLSTSPLESEARSAKSTCAVKDEFENYDVFISHRGPDTKTGFVGFLFEGLKRAGLHPFLDCESIGKGQNSWECIVDAIKRAPLALVIFSESFAQSEWCLNELHEMLNCPSVKVLPIFYNVEPWELKHLEKGQLAEGFKKLTKRHGKTLIEQWRADLKQASKINGWEHRVGDKSLEKDLVQKVVGKIFELANKPLPLHVGDDVVGVKQVVENLIQTLDEKKVLMLGLWGMGGIGKTTLAQELYNQLRRRFDASCYVGNVTEKVTNVPNGVPNVPNEILKDICGNGSMQNVSEESRAKVILQERLSKKQILVVLDDVLDENQMGSLMSRQMFKEGSMCIATSRNCRVFEKSTLFDPYSEVHIYEVQALNPQDSQSLFASHAFGGEKDVPQGFQGLVRDVSLACGGVPLVLLVCASLLRMEENVEIWKEVLKKLSSGTMMDEEKIFKCLRISYDTLQEEFQEMFLDIACALIGQSAEMTKIVWKSQDWHAAWGIRSLVEKALITVDAGNIRMHDHLRDMGRMIAKQENTSLGVYKRLWGSESLGVYKRLWVSGLALPNEKETLFSTLQTLVLPYGRAFRIPRIRDDFFRMKSLRILRCGDGVFPMSSFPENLNWLDMSSSFTPVPESPEMNRLVVLYWRCGAMQRLPKSFGNLNRMKLLDLRGCQELVKLPKSFGCLNRLEELNLGECRRIVELPNSFGDLKNLKCLSLSSTAIQRLPESFGMLSNLEELDLSYCNQLVELPNSFGRVDKLRILILRGSAVRSLPHTFGTSSGLNALDLVERALIIRGIREVPETPKRQNFGARQSLEDLTVNDSLLRLALEAFVMFRNLEVIDLILCKSFGLYHLPQTRADLIRFRKNISDKMCSVKSMQF